MNQARGGQGNEVDNILKNTFNDYAARADESHEAEGQTEEEDTELAPEEEQKIHQEENTLTGE